MARTTETDLFLGLDIGTSSLKGILVSSRGDVAWRGAEGYRTQRPKAGQVEQQPVDWLRALLRLTQSIPEDLKRCIAAIGTDGHVPSLVLVDDHGQPVGPCLTWQDSRAELEAQQLAVQFGDPMPLFGTTIPWAASQLPAKAAWFSRHEPVLAAQARHLMQPKDFLNLELTGVAMTDAWGAKGLVHVGTGQPAAEVLEALGWSKDVVPPIGLPWDVQGGLLSSVAERLGLNSGIPVVIGWTDAMSSILAVGGFDRPSAVVLAGTSEIVGSSGSEVGEAEGLYLVPESVAPRGLSYGPTQLSGGALLWISETLGLDLRNALDLAAQAGAAPAFTPYLLGERSPVWDPAVRGTFLGLGAEHGPAELVRAVLEGVAYGARHVLDRSQLATGTAPGVVNVGGRGVDHPAWASARATALRVPLRLHLEPNLTALGSAMLASLGVGGSLESLDSLRSITKYREPTAEEAERGQRGFDLYLEASRICQEWSKK